MKAFKKRGALTHFQILSEISKQNPHLKQKDLAETLGITIQAVSENIKTLIEQEYITSKDGRSPYKITQKGIDKVKRDAISLRKYSDSVLETMNHYKTVWPAIAKEDLKKDEIVGLSRAVANMLNLPVTIEYAAPQATANAARKGLNVLALCVGDMTKAFTRELEEQKIKFDIIDGGK